MSAAVLVETVFYTALTPLVPHYSRSTGLGSGGVGLLVAAYPAGTLMASLPIGRLEPIGARRTMVLGMVLMTISTLTFGWSSQAGILIAARLVQGIGGTCAWTAGLASLSAAAPPDQRGRFLGIAFSAAVGGSIAGPALGAAAAHAGSGPVFSLAAVFAASVCAFSGLLPPRSDRTALHLRQVPALFRLPDLAGGLWFTALAGFGLGVLTVLAPLRLSSLGGSATRIATAFVFGGILEAALSPLVGGLADRRGPRFTVVRSLALCALLSVLVPLLGALTVTLVAAALATTCFGTLFVPGAAMVSAGADAAGVQPGLVFGLTNLMWASGMGIASATSGYLADATSRRVPFFLTAVICVATLVVCQRSWRGRAGRQSTVIDLEQGSMS